MTRAAIIGGVDGVANALTAEERAEIDAAIVEFLKSLPTQTKEEEEKKEREKQRGEFLDQLERAVAVERRLYEPSKSDDRERAERLIALQQSGNAFLRAIENLDDGTKSLIRREDAFSWLASIPQFEEMLAGAQFATGALTASATSIISRSDRRRATDEQTQPKKRRAEKADFAPWTFLTAVSLAYYAVFHRRPVYSKGSHFVPLINAILAALRMPRVGESRLRGVIEDLLKRGEFSAKPAQSGPPHTT